MEYGASAPELAETFKRQSWQRSYLGFSAPELAAGAFGSSRSSGFLLLPGAGGDAWSLPAPDLAVGESFILEWNEPVMHCYDAC